MSHDNALAVSISLAIAGWIVAILFLFLWRHAEHWNERHFQDWQAAESRNSDLEADRTRIARERDARLDPWSCPACAFTMDAAHTEEGKLPKVYCCPACFQDRAEKLIRRLLRTRARDFKPWTVKAQLRALLVETEYPKSESRVVLGQGAV